MLYQGEENVIETLPEVPTTEPLGEEGEEQPSKLIFHPFVMNNDMMCL